VADTRLFAARLPGGSLKSLRQDRQGGLLNAGRPRRMPKGTVKAPQWVEQAAVTARSARVCRVVSNRSVNQTFLRPASGTTMTYSTYRSQPPVKDNPPATPSQIFLPAHQISAIVADFTGSAMIEAMRTSTQRRLSLLHGIVQRRIISTGTTTVVP
jgi:hypothetical protein